MNPCQCRTLEAPTCELPQVLSSNATPGILFRNGEVHRSETTATEDRVTLTDSQAEEASQGTRGHVGKHQVQAVGREKEENRQKLSLWF